MVTATNEASINKENAAPAISVRHITKVFGGVRALDDVSFEVAQGEVHCLAGENGCGKSTIIKVITGVYTPESHAEMTFFGERINQITPNEARRLGVAVIWQDLALFSEMSVLENISFEILMGNRPRLVSYSTLREKAATVLSSLDIDIPLDVRLNTLPIAQRQIVAIARALVSDARLIFMDEPTSSLTQSETDSLLGIVRTLSASGVSVVFVSHRLAEVLEISTRVTVLRDGQLVGVYKTEGMTQSNLTELMTGKTFDEKVIAENFSGSETVLEVEKLSRAGEYEDISLSVRKGEVVGLTGLIGAGRTELALSLFGINHPDDGVIRLNGQELRLRSNRDAVKSGIAYVSEDRLALGLVLPQSISDNTVITILKKISGLNGLISTAKKDEMVNNWISELAVKIGHSSDALSTLSGGNQQRIVLAKWLATEPKVLILDSPTVGVDVGARAGIFKIVRKLAKQGLAILMISDEVPEVYFNSDRILHMAAGKIVKEYDPRKLTLRELEEAIYG